MSKSKKFNVMVGDEKVGEITPFEAKLTTELIDMERTEVRVFKIDCPSKEAPEIDQIIYNGKVYKPVKE